MSERSAFEIALLKLYSVSRVFISLAEENIELKDEVVTGLYFVTEDAFEELTKIGKSLDLSERKEADYE
jgi:hypothetical protein